MTACISHSKSGRNPLVLPLKLNPTFAELLHGYIILVWSATQEISIFSLESQWCHNRSRARGTRAEARAKKNIIDVQFPMSAPISSPFNLKFA